MTIHFSTQVCPGIPSSGKTQRWGMLRAGGVSTEGDVTATWWEITSLSHQSHRVTCGLHMWECVSYTVSLN